MQLTRFQDLLDARGPDLARWPEADREDAEALLAQSDQARAALAEAEALDRAMAELPVEPASPLLRAAILDIPEIEAGRAAAKFARDSRRMWFSRHPGMTAGWTAIAASAAIGFMVGAWWPTEQSIWQSEDLVALVYGAPTLGEVLR